MREFTDTWVSVDDTHIYPARVDLSNRWNGWLSPGFTLDAVRQLAAHTQQTADELGYDCTDQIVVIDGEPAPVVLHIRWQWVTDDQEGTVNVVQPDADGRYWIGGWEWTWYQVADGPLFYTKNAAFDAWRATLTESARLMGEILRTLKPDAISALVDLTGLGRIVSVQGTDVDWPISSEADPGADGEDGYGPFDTETLGEADEVLRKALDHGHDPLSLELAGWRPARDIGEPDLVRIVFGPRSADPAGEGPLEEARAKATEARRKLLTDYVPYLVRECREACPGATGVVVDPAADDPFVTFLVEDPEGQTVDVPGDLAQQVDDRLAGMFTYRPTSEDLAACGWTPVPAPHLDGAFGLTFPAE
ncbi:hypothetical protein [Streptomyces sp. NPDC053560]|uniref:hypothetical protein n=1 Tax=Streptomyces sp. NPDC053560 TaxID=3365711 RepID=UPI0037CEF346